MIATFTLLLTLALDGQAAFLRTPDIYGDSVVFSCEGDLWLGSLTTHKATRLTRDEGLENAPRFSPDGTQIAFSGYYDGFREVYLIPTEGGVPKRVSYRYVSAGVTDWSPDGKEIMIRSLSGLPGFIRLYTIPAGGGEAKALPLEWADTGSFAPDGNRFVFTRQPRANSAWFRYEGGEKNDVWVGDRAANTFKKIHTSRYTNEFPVWAGDRICFIKDEGDGTFSVMACNPDGGGIKRLAGPYDLELRNLQTDGKRLIYEKGMGLEVVDLAGGKPVEAAFDLTSDKLHTRPYSVPVDRHLRSASLSPSGKRVLVESRGQIVSLPAKDGEARVLLAKGGAQLQMPTLSPDNKRLAYISDETREQQVYVADPDGSNPKAVTSDTGRQIRSLRWSPDSKWLAVTDSNTRLRVVMADGSKDTVVGRGSGWSGPPFDISSDSRWIAFIQEAMVTRFGTLHLFEVDTATVTVVGQPLFDDSGVAFSRDGNWLAILSRRGIDPHWDAFLPHFNVDKPVKPYLLALRKDVKSPFLVENDEEPAEKKPEEKKDGEKKEPQPIKIELDGLYGRFVELPVAGGDYGQIAMLDTRLFLAGGGDVTYYDIKSKSGGTLTSGGAFELSADGKKMLVRGAGLRIVDPMAGSTVAASEGRVPTGGLQLAIDPTKEWEQIFWDAWRLLRDYFYVANMHGADWKAIGDKYAAMLPAVRSRDELSALIRWMQAELSTGHMYSSEGDAHSLFKGGDAAFLGIELELSASGYYRISKIYRGNGYDAGSRSPFAQPGMDVKEGDYLLEVAGAPVKEGVPFMERLVGRAGQAVSVKVNTEAKVEGARTLYVKAVGDEGDMRYQDWVRRNREYVARVSNGRVGYLHLAAMGQGDYADFVKQYFGQRDKEALIVDVRFNGGGNISNTIISVLKQKAIAYFNQRNAAEPWSRQHEYFPGPLACLINEFSASNGEEFPHHFKALGLGPLIGARTWGGEVGSSPGWPLVDGGVVNVPNYGAFEAKKGWVIEGVGMSPDIEVPSDPNLYVKGIDPQLDRAVAYLLDEVKKRPVERPKDPPAPVKVKPKR